MAIIDANLNFFVDEAVTTATTYTSDSVAIDQGENGTLVGSIAHYDAGEPLEVIVLVTEGFDSGGTSVDFRFVSSNAAALSSPVTQASTGAITDPAEGTVYKFPLRFSATDADATHIGMTLVSLGTYSTGKVSAWIQSSGNQQTTVDDLGVDLQD